MTRRRWFGRDRRPTRSYAKAFGVSVGLHATVAALVVIAYAGRSVMQSRATRSHAGIVGDEARTGTGGVLPVAAPAAGPSLHPELGARYVGRYVWKSPTRAMRVLDVRLINDGETEHWSLAVVEDQGPLRTLVVVARDTFEFQLAPAQKVLFRRVGDSVTAVSIRRGRDTSWGERAP